MFVFRLSISMLTATVCRRFLAGPTVEGMTVSCPHAASNRIAAVPVYCFCRPSFGGGSGRGRGRGGAEGEDARQQLLLLLLLLYLQISLVSHILPW
jgi:hypothetical protein